MDRYEVFDREGKVLATRDAPRPARAVERETIVNSWVQRRQELVAAHRALQTAEPSIVLANQAVQGAATTAQLTTAVQQYCATNLQALSALRDALNGNLGALGAIEDALAWIDAALDELRQERG